MCPPAASSASFGKLGPIVPLGAQWVIGMCDLPGAVVGGAHLVVVDSAPSLDRRRGAVHGKGTWQWQGCGWLRGEGALCSFSCLAGKGALAAAVAMVAFRHIGVVDRAVVLLRFPGYAPVGPTAPDRRRHEARPIRPCDRNDMTRARSQPVWLRRYDDTGQRCTRPALVRP
jgi:hypothetical protein